MKKIFLLILSMIVVFLGTINVNANYTYENNNYTDYRYVEYYNYDDGYRIKHYVLYSDNTRNVGRTELYKNGILVDYVDTVFFATGSEYVYGDMIGTLRYSKIRQIIKNEDKIEIYYEYRGPNGMLEYLNKNTFYIGGKKEIDDFSSSISVFGSKGKHFLVKLNLKNSGETISSLSYYDSLWETGAAAIRGWVWPTVYYGTNGCSFLNIENKETEYKINYKCIVKTVITGSSAGGPGSTTLKDIFPSFTLSKQEYSLCNYNEEYCEEESTQIPTPTNLNQYIKSPLLEREEIEVGTTIGKFQSGSGVILEASIQNDTTNSYNIVFEVYKHGQTIPMYTDIVELVSGTGTITIPYLGEGNYTWKVKAADDNGNTSEIVDYATNQSWEIDFSLFEGFEPYPYGFSFVNVGPDISKLTGGISGKDGFFKDTRKIEPGRLWDIFYNAFDVSSFNNDQRKLMDAFETTKIENGEIFKAGSCYGLAYLSILNIGKPEYLETNFENFYSNIKDKNLYDNVLIPSSSGSLKWDLYNDTLKTILTLHAMQYSSNNKKVLIDSQMTANEALQLLKKPENKNKLYLLDIYGEDKDGKTRGHTVFPYRVEGNKIYIVDSNVIYPEIKNKNINYISYNQYIEVTGTGFGDWKSELYSNLGRKKFTDISLMSLEDLYNGGNKSTPFGFGENDSLYTLSGNSDIILADSLGRKTGYKNGEIFNEIPGVKIITPLNENIGNEENINTWKQIYLPQKLENLAIEINGKTEENYDLMIAGGDYYTKLEGISTSSGQTDTFNISRENIKIDFDDNKNQNNTYNILVDDFQNNSTGSIYIHQLETIKENQNLDIDWNKVVSNEYNSISYSIDINNDGIYDIESYFNSLPKSENETGSISGQVISSPSNAGYKLCIDLNNNGTCEENIEPFIVTDNTGKYKFDNLNKGNYTIIQVPRNNWEIIKPLDKIYTIKLNNGQNIVNLNFENQKINGNKNNKK